MRSQCWKLHKQRYLNGDHWTIKKKLKTIARTRKPSLTFLRWKVDISTQNFIFVSSAIYFMTLKKTLLMLQEQTHPQWLLNICQTQNQLLLDIGEMTMKFNYAVNGLRMWRKEIWERLKWLISKQSKKNIGCLKIHGTHVTAKKSTNNNVVFFFLSDLKIVYYNSY